MQQLLIKCVNFALLIIIVIGVPAVTRAQFWNARNRLRAETTIALVLGFVARLGRKHSRRAFLFKSRKERKLCWEWAAVFGVLLFAYSAFVLGYFKFDWLKLSCCGSKAMLNRAGQIAPEGEIRNHLLRIKSSLACQMLLLLKTNDPYVKSTIRLSCRNGRTFRRP